MGYTLIAEPNDDNEFKHTILVRELTVGYCPLHDDAQAMAMVKKFELQIHGFSGKDGREWCVNFPFTETSGFRGYHTFNADLNRAICECVASIP